MRTPRILLLAWLGAIAVSLASSQPSPSTYSPTPTPTTLTDAARCQTCGVTQECSLAYQGEPGRYCGLWTNSSTQQQLPCCCPVAMQCAVSASACTCADISTTVNGFPAFAIVLIVVSGVGFAIAACIKRAKRKAPPTQKPGTAGNTPVVPNGDSGVAVAVGDRARASDHDVPALAETHPRHGFVRELERLERRAPHDHDPIVFDVAPQDLLDAE
ncbi:hypothetical protein PybrP1_013014, partial [[Pythium] brassicae (nom. inval.)]